MASTEMGAVLSRLAGKLGGLSQTVGKIAFIFPRSGPIGGVSLVENQPLTEIAPFTWSNGHLRFDPIRRAGQMAWEIRLERRDLTAATVGHIRFNSAWREYVLLTKGGYVFAHDCLADIVQLLRILNARR